MGRLTRRLRTTNEADCAYCTYQRSGNGNCSSDCELWRKQLEKLAHYEDLEEQGLLAVRKQGRWIPNKQMIRTPTAENYHCSECTQTGKTTAYCPNCGAKMELKELEGDKE